MAEAMDIELIPAGTVVTHDGCCKVELLFPSENDAIIFVEIINRLCQSKSVHDPLNPDSPGGYE